MDYEFLSAVFYTGCAQSLRAKSSEALTRRKAKPGSKERK